MTITTTTTKALKTVECIQVHGENELRYDIKQFYACDNIKKCFNLLVKKSIFCAKKSISVKLLSLHLTDCRCNYFYNDLLNENRRAINT